jgi:CDP-diacylglycerol--glycerol-3-phosphate 3-phosphatidyltransferase
MNLPNLLTLARIFLVPVFLFAFLARLEAGGLIAAAVFVIAAATDGVDGYLARRQRAITRLGKFLDPLADKLLVSAALIAMVERGLISTWAAVIIIGRELAVTGLRAIAAAEGTVIAAGPWGKAKTVVQIVFIVDALLVTALSPGTPFGALAHRLLMPLLWAAVLLTLWSAVDYFAAYYRGLAQNPNENRRFLRRRVRLSTRRIGSRRPHKPS